MKLVFLGAYFNHHQRYLCDALSRRCAFHFIATKPYNPKRLALGWQPEEEPDYVCHYDRDPERAQRLLEQAQVVLTGSAPESLVQQCIRRNQPVLRYSERPLKDGPQWSKYLPRFFKWHLQNPPFRPIYLLCASAYTASDYARFALFRGKAYRWGYFPEQKVYKELPRKKTGSLLWAGRFIDWKHPQAAVNLAARLKAAGYDFTLELIGTGPLESQLKEQIARQGLEDWVAVLGAMPPEQVRQKMEQAEIYLFTSGAGEGWGVVLNEAMNSGCCAAANRAAGASAFLIRDGENGLLYETEEELFQKVAAVLADPNRAKALGAQAYQTICEEWNPDVAAERLLGLCDRLLRKETAAPYGSGPCSDVRKEPKP